MAVHGERSRHIGLFGWVSVPRETLEARLLAVLRDEILSPGALTELEGYVKETLAARRREDSPDVRALRNRIVELDKEIERLVDAIVSVGHSECDQ